MKRYFLVVTILLFSFYSFSQKKDINDQLEVIKLENEVSKQKISNLELRISNLQKDIDDLKKIVQDLQTKNSSVQQGGTSGKSTLSGENVQQSTILTSPTVKEKTITPKKQSTNVSSGQCRATTQKGSRCSRTARSNGYCWQHGG